MRALRPRQVALRCAPLLLLLTGCSYPEFAFVDDADGAFDSSIADDTQPDVADEGTDAAIDTVADSEAPDDAADSSLPSDASLDGEGETASDAGADARDAVGDTRDASADTRDAMDAAETAPRPCALSHLFCSDFDQSTTPQQGWSGTFGTGSAMLDLDTTTSVSAPKSLVASLSAGTTTSSAMVTRNILSVPLGATIRVEADVMVDSLTYTSMYDLILLKIQRSSAGDGVTLTAGSTGVRLGRQAPDATELWPITGIVAGKWFHVRMEAVLHTTAGVARVYIDRATTPQIEKTGIATADVDDTTGRQLVVGVFAFQGSAPYRVHYDNVTLDLP